MGERGPSFVPEEFTGEDNGLNDEKEGGTPNREGAEEKLLSVELSDAQKTTLKTEQTRLPKRKMTAALLSISLLLGGLTGAARAESGEHETKARSIKIEKIEKSEGKIRYFVTEEAREEMDRLGISFDEESGIVSLSNGIAFEFDEETMAVAINKGRTGLNIHLQNRDLSVDDAFTDGEEVGVWHMNSDGSKEEPFFLTNKIE